MDRPRNTHAQTYAHNNTHRHGLGLRGERPLGLSQRGTVFHTASHTLAPTHTHTQFETISNFCLLRAPTCPVQVMNHTETDQYVCLLFPCVYLCVCVYLHPLRRYSLLLMEGIQIFSKGFWVSLVCLWDMIYKTVSVCKRERDGGEQDGERE